MNQIEYVNQSMDVITEETITDFDIELVSDLRLKPKDRKLQELWQRYLWWDELVELRKKHTLRISSIRRGKSNMNEVLEEDYISKLELDANIYPTNKKERADSIYTDMLEEAVKVGPIWDWLLGHKGIGEKLAIQVLAHIDNIENFESIAKLWRYAGYGLYEYWVDDTGDVMCPKEGWKWIEIKPKVKYRVWTIVDNHVCNVNHAYYVLPEQYRYAKPQNNELPLLERVDYLEPKENWHIELLSDRLCEKYHSPFNKKFKSVLWNLVKSFIYQKTPVYADLYYAEKIRLREKFPVKIKRGNKFDYTDAHIANMAERRVKKEFLKNLWLKWREFEGLPLSQEYSK